MPPKPAMTRTRLFALFCAATLASTIHAEEASLSTQREFWNADQLYQDFLAEFGKDTKSCYADYTINEGPPMPGGPQTMGQRWKKAVIAIDASGSMIGRIGGKPKMDAAKAAVRKFLDAVPPDAEIGLLAFGHRGSNTESGKSTSCNAVEMLSDVAKVDKAKLSAALDGVQATGWTPLAAAITQAGKSFPPASGEGEQVVFVVSDGLETCGGDPVAAAKALRQSQVKAVVNIIGFNIAAKDRKALEAVAQAGGGIFSQAANQRELEQRLRVEHANLQEWLDYDHAALSTKNANNTSTLEATNHANTCVLDITNGENTRFLTIANQMIRDGQTDAESRDEARERLAQRHRELKAEMEAFRKQAIDQMTAVNDRISAQRERVKATYHSN